MKNLLEQISNADFHGMRNVVRYNGMTTIKPENLAEHGYYVSILADLLATDIENSGLAKDLDRGLILKTALYHDYDEVYTGDINTPAKNKLPSFKKELGILAAIMLKDGLFSNFVENEHVAHHIMNTMDEYEKSKTTKLENAIVKFSDGFQSVIYCLRESRIGNKEAMPVAKKVSQEMDALWRNHPILGKYITDLFAFLSFE